MKTFIYTLIIWISTSLVLHAQNSMNMTNIYNWTGGGEVASSAYGNVYNEVWGYAQNGREYAIIGTTQGTHFLDITTIEEATEVDFVPGLQQGPVVVHRDYHNTIITFTWFVKKAAAFK